MEKQEETKPVVEEVKTKDEDDGKAWGFEPAGELSAEQEASLAVFLNKVSDACKWNTDVPPVVSD